MMPSYIISSITFNWHKTSFERGSESEKPYCKSSKLIYPALSIFFDFLTLVDLHCANSLCTCYVHVMTHAYRNYPLLNFHTLLVHGSINLFWIQTFFSSIYFEIETIYLDIVSQSSGNTIQILYFWCILKSMYCKSYYLIEFSHLLRIAHETYHTKQLPYKTILCRIVTYRYPTFLLKLQWHLHLNLQKLCMQEDVIPDAHRRSFFHLIRNSFNWEFLAIRYE